MAAKQCIKCHIYKDISLFFKNKDTKDGHLNTCKLCHVAQKREIIKRNSEYYTSKRKERYLLNRESDIKRSTEWNKNNKQKFSESKKRYEKNHPEIYKGISHRLRHTISARMRRILKEGKNGISWSVLVGYDAEQLKEHLGKQFTENMCWDNYGIYWEVDHIIPVSAFTINSSEDDDFKKCWALKNLRPLSISENRSQNYNRVPILGT